MKFTFYCNKFKIMVHLIWFNIDILLLLHTLTLRNMMNHSPTDTKFVHFGQMNGSKVSPFNLPERKYKMSLLYKSTM